ncbi:MAG TPA: hypothetical protein VHO04_07790 [Sphingopyxis sp.]|jgi:hypothetical protein|uniref:hypothetical protein n=1 Tax=Sphingopyxis sp. TaxID=1908224 RepID=UPI002E30F9BD|nr:hypothetical protein [Sphingopyxis sp.]HEX2812569.1 hypothetical protein [Sphingopyxis sp.]
MRTLIPAILAAAAMLAAPAAFAKDTRTPEQQLEKLLEGRVAGTPQDCINLAATNSSQVIDKTAIVYRVGNTLWVNRPRGGADQLGEDDILVTKTTSSRLCSIDTVELHDRTSHMYSGFVSLGEFVPYRKVKAAAQ